MKDVITDEIYIHNDFKVYYKRDLKLIKSIN